MRHKKSREMKKELLRESIKIQKNKSKKSNSKKNSRNRELEKFRKLQKRNNKNWKTKMRTSKKALFRILRDLKFYRAKRKTQWSFHQPRIRNRRKRQTAKLIQIL